MIVYARFIIIILSFLSMPKAYGACDGKPLSDAISEIIQGEENIQNKLDLRLSEAVDGAYSQKAVMGSNQIDDAVGIYYAKADESQSKILENKTRLRFLYDLKDKVKSLCKPDAQFQDVLKDLAIRELKGLAEAGKESKDNPTYRFIINLTIAVRDIYEPSEDFGKFLKNYMIFSSITHPQPISGFLKTRDYIGD